MKKQWDAGFDSVSIEDSTGIVVIIDSADCKEVIMDCKEANRMIPDFLEHSLGNRELRLFMDHISVCKDCKEELSIQFLVQEGMVRLEEGDSFDLQQELERILEDARKRMRMRQLLHWFVYVMEVLAILAIIAVIVVVML